MQSFQEAVDSKKKIICAEGYIFELQRRGLCQAGPYVPTIILERPDVIRQIHYEFAHAGSSILVACQYYCNKYKLAQINQLELFENLNRQALKVCHEAARETGTFAAGNLCNSVDYNPSDDVAIQQVREMFREQVQFAQETGVDLYVCETFRYYGEASLALDTVKTYAPGVPCVVSIAPYLEKTRDGLTFAEAMKKLRGEGATVVGLNCARGPDTMLEELRLIRKEYDGPLSASPIPYRTTKEQPSWLVLQDPKTGETAFPDALDAVGSSCLDISNFGKAAAALNINYLGICCGNSARYTRELAHSVGVESQALRFKTNIAGSVFMKESKEFKAKAKNFF